MAPLPSNPAHTFDSPDARRGSVKIGRRANVNSYCGISRPHLDRPERGGSVVCAWIDRLLLVASREAFIHVCGWTQAEEQRKSSAR